MKYDYITKPKASGYRGIHDVYSHKPRSHRRNSNKNLPWHDLMVEVQYRTRVQHAWATALEISDIIDGQRTKFDLNDNDRKQFFALASEILARHHEGIENAYDGLNLRDLISEFNKLEGNLHILQRLSGLRESENFGQIKIHNVLNIYKDDRNNEVLEVLTFPNATQAIERASKLESNDKSLNAVYVRADKPNQVLSAYRNYFNNPVDFVQLMREALNA